VAYNELFIYPLAGFSNPTAVATIRSRRKTVFLNEVVLAGIVTAGILPEPPICMVSAVGIVLSDLSYLPLETVLSKHSTPFEATPKSA
jgi:hypothetical protein